jgi:hypothetical protein
MALNRPAETSQARGLAGTPSLDGRRERLVQRFFRPVEIAEQPN